MTGDPVLIGHRGERAHFPENTVEALLAAAHAGADGVEFDIQFAADLTPVVMHDPDTARTTGRHGLVHESSVASLKRLRASEPGRFGDRFRDVRVPLVSDVIAALGETPGVTLFPEIKADGLPPPDIHVAVRTVLDACTPLLERTVIIGFDEEILRVARESGAPSIGWAVKSLDPWQESRARALKPEYLFADRDDVSSGSLWPGAWRWIVYEVNDAAEARRMVREGAWGVETASVAGLKAALAGS